MSEYAFDVKLWACARVRADSVKEARRKMLGALGCIDLRYECGDVVLTEASIEDDSGEESQLFEINGEAV